MSEILAPVGSVDALKTAIYAGADAVYLGLDLFNARIKADNFTLDNIKEYVDLAHLFGVKVYVAFNINIKESEKALLDKYVKACSDAFVDAFIVTDLGCLDIYRKYDVPLHASTQMGVHNLYGAKLLESLGFTRVVLSREALEKDILEIKQNTNLEIEYFVHGALCVCFSGGCLLSSFMNGDSGNRGRCNQPCRLQYTTDLNNKPPKYLLSASDQCLIEKIDRLRSIGVDSFKIEGRLKQPHYVGEVVSIYRQIIDKKAQYNFDKKSRLLRAYNRGGFTLGYNYDQTPDIMSSNIQGNLGEYIGEITGNMRRCAVLSTKRELHENDGVKFVLGGKELFGMAVKGISMKGKDVLIPTQKPIKPGTKVYLTLDQTQVERYKNVAAKLYCDVALEARVGKKIKFTMKSNGVEYTAKGDFIEESLKYKADSNKIKENINKFGTSNFELRHCEINVDDNSFVPASLVNNLRRECISAIENKLLSIYEANIESIDYSKYPNKIDNDCDKKINKDLPFVEIDDISLVTNLVKSKANLVITLNDYSAKNIKIILDFLLNHNKNSININNTYIKVPRIARDSEIQIIENFVKEASNSINGLVCDNLYAIYLAKKYKLSCIGGIGLNIYNQSAIETLGLDYAICSVELNANELQSFNKDFCIYSYGYLPIMTLTHCPIQLNTGCTCANCQYSGDFTYRDKMATYLLSRTKVKHCYFSMYNPSIIDIREKFNKLPYNNYLNMIRLNKEEIDKVLSDYINKTGNKAPNSTLGHYLRGVL